MTLPVTDSLLHRLGWDDGWEAAFAEHRAVGLEPARVAIQHRGAYDLLGEVGELRASAANRLVRDDRLPAVGDWVGVDPTTGMIEALLDRRTVLSRKETLDTVREQVLAANVDVAFLVQALPLDFNVRRLERYLAMAWESGAQPVVLLTKTDLVDDLAPFLAEVETVTLGACPGRGGLGEDRRGARRPAALVRGQPHGRPARLLRRRQVDDRQRARGRGAARDAGGA